MRKIIYITFCMLTSLLLGSCSNDFLDENNKEIVGTVGELITIYNSDNSFQTLTVNVPQAENRSYTIKQYPNWMKFTAMESKFQAGVAEMGFYLVVENDYTGFQQEGPLVLDIEGLGYVELHVRYTNLGNPVIVIFPEDIYFPREITESSFEIMNTGDGYLDWKIVSKPEWITFQYPGEQEGRIPQRSSKRLYINCNRADLTQGTYKGDIVIESNSKGSAQPGGKVTSKVKVSMEVIPMENPKNVLPISGSVVGAKFDKKHNLLYVLTKSPSELIIYDIKRGGEPNVQKFPISGAPGCFSLSEDGNQLFVGCSGKLLHYEASSMRLVKSVDLDFMPFDVIYGENDWCYLSPNADSGGSGMYCVNIKTNEIKTSKLTLGYWSMSTKAYFTKTPGVSKLLATSSSLSPSGVYLFDITEPVPNEQSPGQYWHVGYSNNRPLWLSENGDLIYTSQGVILRNPAKKTIEGDLLPMGYLSDYYMHWIDHCEANHSIWNVPQPDFYQSAEYNVFRENDTDYSTMDYMKSSDYVTTINNVKAFYKTCVHYIFSNKEGTVLFMVKNVNNYGLYSPNSEYINDWSLEYVGIN